MPIRAADTRARQKRQQRFSLMGSKPSPPTIIQQAPVPTPSPPVTQAASEVVQSKLDVAQQQLMRKNMKSTIRAGDTGGFRPPGMAPGKPFTPVGGNPFVAPQGTFRGAPNPMPPGKP